ncbi:hypothetical protein LBMAG42_19670 [Deltaproteobacteria bacterium]|nr:hypothetical protein LBMAG42_19670 [Deltaproteobacteria bacterium]
MRNVPFALILVTVAAGVPGAAYGGEAPETPGAGVYTATLADEFYLTEDLMLSGVHATRDITFTRPATWTLTADPVLHVAFEHSAALIAARSHLTIVVNDHPIGTVTLGEDNVTGSTFDVRIPRSMLQDFNHLGFLVDQHYTDDCEDPFDPALWTRVRTTTAIDLAYERKPVEGELLKWPYPLVDRLGYGPTQVTLVTTGAPSKETVDALGIVGFALGRLADYREVDAAEPVASSAEARTPALLIGTTAELPEALTLTGLASLAPDEGMVALVPNPADNTLPVLVVTGGGPEGLLKAARALAGQDRYQVLSGTVSTISQVSPANPPPTKQKPLPAPPATKFTLKDLGIEGQTVRGFYASSIRIPLKLEGDALAQPGGGSLRVDYGYSAQLDSRLSSMEVRLGGLTLRTVPLDKVAGESQASVSVPLPQDILAADSNIDIVFHLFPRDFDECERVADHQISGTVYASTTVELPRDHVAEMPDLSLLRFGNWPFTALPGSGGTVVALPDAPDARAEAAAFILATRFGKLTPAPTPDFSLVRGADITLADRADKHVILLVDASAHTLYEGLVAASALTLTGGPARLLANGKEVLLAANVRTPYGTIEEAFSPANASRAVLVVRALREDGLAPLVESLTDLGKVKKLSGNVAIVGADLDVRTLSVATIQRWGTVAVATAATREIQRNWWVLGAMVIGGIFLLTAFVRVFAQARGSRE